MKKSSMRGEVMRNAQRLIQTRGSGAFDYACNIADRMQELDEEKNQAFWKKIARQVELLLHSEA